MACGEPKTYADGFADGMREAARGIRNGSVVLPDSGVKGLEARIEALTERLDQLERRFPIEVFHVADEIKKERLNKEVTWHPEAEKKGPQHYDRAEEIRKRSLVEEADRLELGDADIRDMLDENYFD